VRGTDRGGLHRCLCVRFIPACAGNSARLTVTVGYLPVHPRVCGEQVAVRSSNAPLVGSSPRVRGTGVLHFGDKPFRRFIPACAGNRHRPSLPARASAVHPRVCGEQSDAGPLASDADGSSPRVRGTGCDGRGKLRLGRFIPACAGNRQARPYLNRQDTVHPRVCGEQGARRVAY